MLNDDASNLKARLKSLHDNLASAGNVDEELQSLLRELDADIKALLARRADEEASTAAYGLAERSQEIAARFAVQHPRLEPALRELGEILASMGI